MVSIIESIVGARFSRISCLFIQDDLYKQKGLVYIDKNDGLLYECLKDGNVISNTTEYFRLISLTMNEVYSKNDEVILTFYKEDMSVAFNMINEALLKSKYVACYIFGGCFGALNVQNIHAKYRGSEVYFANYNSADNWSLEKIESNGVDDNYSQTMVGIGRTILLKVHDYTIEYDTHSWNIVSKNV